jgi:hypothetical protein
VACIAITRTKLLFEQRDTFMGQLAREIAAHARKAEKLGMRAAVRLNGTSDLPVETGASCSNSPL